MSTFRFSAFLLLLCLSCNFGRKCQNDLGFMKKYLLAACSFSIILVNFAPYKIKPLR